MTEIDDVSALARAELARLSQSAKDELHAILGEAIAETDIARAHILTITGKVHAVLAAEVAPLETLAKITGLENSLSDALSAKATLQDALSKGQAMIVDLSKQADDLRASLANAQATITALQAEKQAAQEAQKEPTPEAAPAAAAPQPDPLAPPAA